MVIIDNNNIMALCRLFSSFRDSKGNLRVKNINDARNKDWFIDSSAKYYFDTNGYDRYDEYTRFVVSEPIGTWDVSRVTTMELIFSEMEFTFQEAKYYNVNHDGSLGQELVFYEDNDDRLRSELREVGEHERKMSEKFLDNWDVSNVTNMSYMFYSNKKMTTFINIQSRGGWDTSKVKTMSNMFVDCFSFTGYSNHNNNYIGLWNVSSLEIASNMFESCIRFNGDLSAWNVRSLKLAPLMFDGCREFDNDLSSWTLLTSKKRSSLDSSRWIPTGFDPAALDPNNEDNFMFSEPMSSNRDYWPKWIYIPPPPTPPPVCMTQDEYETCEEGEDLSGNLIKMDPITFEAVERKDAVKLPNTQQCYRRQTLKRMLATTRQYKNPVSGEYIDNEWLDEKLREGNCVEEATGGRRQGRKTKNTHKPKKARRSRKGRKGRKAGRRTRNAKKVSRKGRLTRKSKK